MKMTTSLSDIRLESLRGESMALADLWRDTPAVIVWIRHFG